MSQSHHLRGRRAARLATAAAIAAIGLSMKPMSAQAASVGSLVFDLRVANTGGKEATVTHADDLVVLNLYATVTGQDASSSNDSMNIGIGNFKSSSGGLDGDLFGLSVPSPFNLTGATVGVSRDLDMDGDLDLGTNNTDPVASYDAFTFRSGGIVPNPPGGQWVGQIAFLAGTLTDDSTEVNFFRTSHLSALQLFVDGASYHQTLDGPPIPGLDVSIGAPVVIRGAAPVDPDGTQYLDGTIVNHLTVSNDVRPTPGLTLTLAQGADVTPTGTLHRGNGTLNVIVNDATSGNAGGQFHANTVAVGSTANGTFAHTAGVTETLLLQVGAASGRAGSVTVAGGSFSAGTTIVGAGGVGSLHVSDGNVDLGAVSVAGGSSLELSGGSTFALSAQINGGATFTQAGGDAMVSQGINLGGGGAAAALLRVQAGTLGSSTTTLGGAGKLGSIEQTGGTFSGGVITIGNAASPATSSYTLATGQLLATSIDLHARGILTQTGGSVSLPVNSANPININNAAGAPAQYVISGGSIDTSFLRVQHTNAAPLPGSGRAGGFVQTGGTVNAREVSINPDGTYDALGGALNVARFLGLRGAFDFGNSSARANFGDNSFADFVEGQILNAANATFTGGDGSLMSFASTAQMQSVGTIDTRGMVHVAGEPLAIAQDQRIGGSGRIHGNVANHGTLSPGQSPGRIKVLGNYVQEDTGKLVIEIGAAGGEGYDLLDVEGAAALEGTLDLSLLEDYVPHSTDTFTILTAASISGMFDNAIGTVDFPGGRFDVSYSSDEVTLSNFQAIPEPAGVAVMMVASAGTMLRRRRVI